MTVYNLFLKHFFFSFSATCYYYIQSYHHINLIMQCKYYSAI